MTTTPPAPTLWTSRLGWERFLTCRHKPMPGKRTCYGVWDRQAERWVVWQVGIQEAQQLANRRNWPYSPYYDPSR